MKYSLNALCGLLRHVLRVMVWALLLSWLTACHGESSFPSNVHGYNHTDKDVGTFTVRIGKSEGGGGFLQAHRESGISCCVSVPNPWRPGMTATVGWTDDYNENYQEREVPIPKYDANHVAQVSVHFLRKGEIKVFIPSVGFWNSNYPLKGPEAGLYPGEDPAEVWNHGRKQGKE